jgi:hypothetical protein
LVVQQALRNHGGDQTSNKGHGYRSPAGNAGPEGGEVSGFIYFSRIGDERRINLNMDVVETDGPRIGTISIPFVVEQKREVKAGATSSGA